MNMLRTPRSGLITFAGVLALMVGVFNAISGIAAIAEDDRTEQAAEVLFGVDITVWGWVWLVIGLIQALTGYLVMVRRPGGLMLAVAWAALNATMTVFIIFVYPLWAILVATINIALMYVLLDHADEFE